MKFIQKLKIYKNKKLCRKYPFLIPRNVWTGEISENYNFEDTYNDWLSPGWRKAFGKKLWKELSIVLKEHNYENEFYFTQIKEKWGELRMYFCSLPEDIYDNISKIITKYENISREYCYICGRKTEYYTVGWIMYICKKCAKKFKNSSAIKKIGGIDDEKDF